MQEPLAVLFKIRKNKLRHSNIEIRNKISRFFFFFFLTLYMNAPMLNNYMHVISFKISKNSKLNIFFYDYM